MSISAPPGHLLVTVAVAVVAGRERVIMDGAVVRNVDAVGTLDVAGRNKMGIAALVVESDTGAVLGGGWAAGK